MSKKVLFTEKLLFEVLWLTVGFVIDDCYLLQHQNKYINISIRAGEMDFKVEGLFSVTMFGRLEKYLNSRRSKMAETVTFWPWWQPLNSFCFALKVFLFFLCFPIFFCYSKKWSGRACPPAPISIASAVHWINCVYQQIVPLSLYQILFW